MVCVTVVEAHDLLVPLVVVLGLVVEVEAVVAMTPGPVAVRLVVPLDFLVQMIGLVQCKTVSAYFQFSYYASFLSEVGL